jgi:iron complex outermembrane receptor protein
VAWTPATAELRADLYDLELKNEISFDPAAFTNVNLERTRRQGATVSADWRPLNALQLSAGGQYLRARFTSGPATGKDVPLAARETGRAAATVYLPGEASVALEFLAVGGRPFDGDFANAAGRLAGYGVLHLALQKRWGRWHAGLRVNNLLDRQYTEYGALDFFGTPTFYPSPDRNFWLNVGASL